LLVTANNRLKFEIEIVHDLSCHPMVVMGSTKNWWTEYDTCAHIAILSNTVIVIVLTSLI